MMPFLPRDKADLEPFSPKHRARSAEVSRTVLLLVILAAGFLFPFMDQLVYDTDSGNTVGSESLLDGFD